MAISTVMTQLRNRGPASALIAVALLLAACGSATPTASPAPPTSSASSAPSTATPAAPVSPPASPAVSASPATGDTNAALYTQIEEQVIKLRGLQPKTPVARHMVDQAGLRDLMTQKIKEESPAGDVKAAETLYKQLLLMPQDASLADLLVDLYSTQAAGLYDNKTKQLYVVSKSGALGPVEKVTYAHEYTHALQDQNYDLTGLVGEEKDQSDRSLARTTLVEGDAYLTMGLWAQQNLSAEEMGKIAAATDPSSEAALAKLPEIIKQSLLFPATSGIGLGIRDYTSGGFGAIDKQFAAPPDSTEQIIHPEKLDAGEKPVAVRFPADLAGKLGDGWTVPLQDTIGEMETEILLREGGASNSADAAAGWGGDRVALIEGPGGAVAVVLDTAWDTKADAAEFGTALEPLLAKLKASGRAAAVLTPEPGRVVLVSGSSDDVLGRVTNVLGLAQ